MFYGVNCAYVDNWFAVGFFHADVECGDGFVAYCVTA